LLQRSPQAEVLKCFAKKNEVQLPEPRQRGSNASGTLCHGTPGRLLLITVNQAGPRHITRSKAHNDIWKKCVQLIDHSCVSEQRPWCPHPVSRLSPRLRKKIVSETFHGYQDVKQTVKQSNVLKKL